MVLIIKFPKTLFFKLIVQSFYSIILLTVFTVEARATCDELCSKNWWANSSLKIIEAKLTSSKNLNIRDEYGFRPLHFAVQATDEEEGSGGQEEGETPAKNRMGGTSGKKHANASLSSTFQVHHSS